MHPEARVDVSVEFLDAPKFGGPAYDNTMATYLREKYASRPPEVIVVAGEIALDFVLASRAQMFPGAPVVYLAVNTSHLSKLGPLPGDVVGVGLAIPTSWPRPNWPCAGIRGRGVWRSSPAPRRGIATGRPSPASRRRRWTHRSRSSSWPACRPPR